MRDLIGRTLGHYRIVELIGAGGMGEVYRARDERLDRDVAIKVLPEAVAGDARRLARFEREAELLASLSHKNVAALHGLEEHDGQRFLVMELAEGETLSATSRSRFMAPDHHKRSGSRSPARWTLRRRRALRSVWQASKTTREPRVLLTRARAPNFALLHCAWENLRTRGATRVVVATMAA
jgi:serine/threonine protein kinase